MRENEEQKGRKEKRHGCSVGTHAGRSMEGLTWPNSSEGAAKTRRRRVADNSGGWLATTRGNKKRPDYPLFYPGGGIHRKTF